MDFRGWQRMCHLLINLTSVLQKSGLLQLAKMPAASSQSMVWVWFCYFISRFIVTIEDNA